MEYFRTHGVVTKTPTLVSMEILSNISLGLIATTTAVPPTTLRPFDDTTNVIPAKNSCAVPVQQNSLLSGRSFFGDSFGESGRIVGGVSSTSKIPWIVRIGFQDSINVDQVDGSENNVYTRECSGTIVDERWILTAEFCFQDLNGATMGQKQESNSDNSTFLQLQLEYSKWMLSPKILLGTQIFMYIIDTVYESFHGDSTW